MKRYTSNMICYVFKFLVLQKLSINMYDVKQNVTRIDVSFNIEEYTIYAYSIYVRDLLSWKIFQFISDYVHAVFNQINTF